MTKIFIGKDPFALNKGEVAMLEGIIKIFETYFENLEFSMISKHPEIDKARCDDRINLIDDTHLPANRIKFFRLLSYLHSNAQDILSLILYKKFNLKTKRITNEGLLSAYCQADIITIGHDDALAGIYSGGFPILLILRAISIAKYLKIPVVIFAGSIGPGPINRELSKIVFRFLLNKVDLITLREELSYEYIKSMGVNKPPIYVTADPAFLMPPATPERVAEIMRIECINGISKPLIGISISQVIARWAFPEIADFDEKYRNFITVMAQVVDFLTYELSAFVLFIPHVLGYTKIENDRIAANDIYQLLKKKDCVKLIENEYTPQDLKGLIGQLDFFLGARTHSVISAATMGTPFVAIEYESYKTRGIIGKMLNCEEFVYDIEFLDFDTLIEKINYAWLNRQKIKQELKLKVNGMDERAFMNGKLIRDHISL